MKNLLLLALCVFALPLSADRRLLPPAVAESRHMSILFGATDGTNFLVVGANDGVAFVYLYDANGKVLRGPQPLPLHDVRAVAWAGDYFVFSPDSVTRVASDGTIRDRTPQVLPFTLHPSFTIASDGERLLVRGEQTLYLIDEDAVATELVLPVGTSDVKSFASDGERFVLLRGVDAVAQFTIVDGDDITHVRRTVPKAIANPLLASDGATWAIFDRIDAPHLHLFDADLNFTASKWTSGQITVDRVFGRPGGGYVAQGGALRPPLSPKPFLIELLAPSYVAQTSVDLLAPRSVAANAQALFVADGSVQPMFVGPSLSAWFTAPKPVLPAGVESRVGLGSVRTNADGVSLLTWHLPSRPKTLFAAFVRPDDTLIDATPLEIEQLCASAPSVATDGRDFLLVWTECNNTMATAILAPDAGVVAVRRMSASVENTLRAVSNGTYYGALWSGFDYGVQRYSVLGVMLDSAGNAVIPATPTVGHMLGVANDGDGYRVIGNDSGLFTQKLDHTLAPVGTRTRINNQAVVSPSTFTAGLGGFLYTSDSDGDGIQWKLLYLDAAGRFRSAAQMAQTSVFAAPLIRCQPSECTMIRRRKFAGREILEATSITKNDRDDIALGTPQLLVADLPDHRTSLVPLLFEGTAAAPKRLWYLRFDPATGAYDVFVYEPKARAVRR